MFRTFARREVAPQAEHIDHVQEPPLALLEKAAAQGFLGLTIPEEYGGVGGDAMSYALLMTELGQACLATAVMVGVHISLAAQTILHMGSEEHKRHYLPQLAGGERIGAFALAEPDAGSDPTQLQTTAVLDGETYRLEGVKSWVSNAAIGGLFIVFARVVSGAKADVRSRSGASGITAFLVEPETPGLSIGYRERTMGLRGLACNTVYLDACRVPVANRLGEEGQGLEIARAAENRFRLALAAAALGISQAGFDEGRKFAISRQQFGVSIALKQAIGNYFADSLAEIEMLRHAVRYATWAVDTGQDSEQATTIAKLHGALVAKAVVNRMLQVHGGYGFSDEYPISRLYRDARALEIIGGTDQLQRVALAQQVFAGTSVEVRP
jgi:alkylation response protein AidB-like acyl-CoA dehydrogenase